jgi:DNA-binding transcriptional ArsR family regulator
MRNREINLRNPGSGRSAAAEPRAAMRPDDVERASAAVAGAGTYRELAALFGALADPTRASIVHLLLDHELCTADIAIVLGLKAPVASQHLRILRGLRLVRSRRDGRLVLYRLEDAHVARIVGVGLAHVAER